MDDRSDEAAGFRLGSWTTFRQLGGPLVSLDDLREQVSRLPLDGILGFVAWLYSNLATGSGHVLSPEWQAQYPNLAIVDDWPSTLACASTAYAPGRVPLTGTSGILVHHQNMAWLAHCALLYAGRERTTPEISHRLKLRLCRILLIINDLLDQAMKEQKVADEVSTLLERRAFTELLLRHWQFSWHSELLQSGFDLARRYELMTVYLPPHLPDVETRFREASPYDAIGVYFQALCFILLNLLAPKTSVWLRKSNLTQHIAKNGEIIEAMVKSWSRTPDEYALEVARWQTDNPPFPGSGAFDYVPLRQFLFAEARPGELICPLLPFLCSKAVDEPYFVLSEGPDGRQFQDAMGLAYEDYANGLLGRIAASDPDGPWELHVRPSLDQGRELADACLVRGKELVVFEHKALRPGTRFLRGGPGERVLGPSDRLLNQLDQGGQVTLAEGKGADNGLVTRPMWQQSANLPELLDWITAKHGARPETVYPLITHLADLRVDRFVRAIYLEPLMEAAHLYSGREFRHPQWLHVSDLEALAARANRRELRFSSLLRTKDEQYAEWAFDLYLRKVHGGIGVAPHLIEAFNKLTDDTKGTFPRILNTGDAPCR